MISVLADSILELIQLLIFCGMLSFGFHLIGFGWCFTKICGSVFIAYTSTLILAYFVALFKKQYDKYIQM